MAAKKQQQDRSAMSIKSHIMPIFYAGSPPKSSVQQYEILAIAHIHDEMIWQLQSGRGQGVKARQERKGF